MLARGNWIRLLIVALAMAWVSGVEATEPGGSAPFAVGSVQHVSHAAPDVDSNTAPEPAEGAAGVFEATPPLASVGALVITPTFDMSIFVDPNAAAIESMIDNAIVVFEAQFNDPITVTILFRYATTNPDGTPLSSGTLATSTKPVYSIPLNTYLSVLVADATTTNDATANADLPFSPLSFNVAVAGANGRAIGFNTPPALNADGSLGGPYDGIVTINSSATFAFSRPPTSGQVDAMRATEHEIDEVLGFGSYLNFDPGGTTLEPQDLFSWQAAGVRNVLTTGARYFSIDGGTTNLVGFNQTSPGDFGDWLSGTCPQATPFVQNAFSCAGQTADVTGTSPEGINLDVIGYDLISATTTTTTSSTSTTTTSSTTTSTTTTTTIPPPCASTPAVGCRVAAPGAASVQLKANATPAKDQFKWKWAKGVATAVTDFKDPVAGSATYHVCVYDGSARPQPLMDMDVPPGGTCGTKPCWKASGTKSGTTGFSFVNKVGTTTGLTTTKLKAGSTGKAQVQAAGKGANLPLPTLGLTLPVTVQFVARDTVSTECWQTTFTTEKKNEPTQFSAKGP